MKCPACGNSEMLNNIKDETLTYKGQSLTLHSMKGVFCPACGEGVWDEESYRRYTAAQTAIIRAEKCDVSADIRRIRKGLKLTQTELSEVVGIGKIAFSRYERGETKPPNPLVKLLKLVERHPYLLAEMSSTCTTGKSTPKHADSESEVVRVAEIQERYRDIQDGKVSCIPADDAISQARKRIKR